MTQEEILDYNKRCAEFLTIETAYFPDEIEALDQTYSPLCAYANAAYAFDKEDNPDKTVWDYLKFHSDWNWIMEMVEAIEKKAWVNIKGCAVDISTIANLNAPTKKEAVVDAINQFLIWYEQNK